MRLKRLRSIISSICISTLLALYPAYCHASSLAITNAERVSKDETADTMTIEFDIYWEDSWKDSVNNDAAWLFIKYRNGAIGYAEHATLAQSGLNPTGFNRGTGTAVDLIIPDDKMGLFIQREHIGTGSLNTTDIEVLWDYGADGLADTTADADNLYIMAVEMVYVVEGGFYAGDGDGTNKSASAFQFRDTQPGHVSSEGPIQFQGDTDQDTAWWYDSKDYTYEYADSADFILPEAFPKGFQAYYVMKNEISQKQYSNFLNMLDWDRQANLQETGLTSADAGKYVMKDVATMSSRNTIRLDSQYAGGSTTGPGTFYHDYGAVGNATSGDNNFNQADDGEWIAMNYLKWMDFCALADWMGLRPMTELEFEKACRGPIYPVYGEYAWGDATIAQETAIFDTAKVGEVLATSGGSHYANYGYGITAPHSGPARVGRRGMGLSAPYTRDKASSGYWGIYDLSGNVIELIVAVGVEEALGFSGTHGDGELTSDGYADNSDWPGFDDASGSVSEPTVAGVGTRGGSWILANALLGISNRDSAADAEGGQSRSVAVGGRFVRTAPGAGEQLDYQ